MNNDQDSFKQFYLKQDFILQRKMFSHLTKWCFLLLPKVSFWMEKVFLFLKNKIFFSFQN